LYSCQLGSCFCVIQFDSSIAIYWGSVLISSEEKRQDSLECGSDQHKASDIKIKMRYLVSNPNRPTSAVDSSMNTCYRSALRLYSCSAAAYRQCVFVSTVAGWVCPQVMAVVVVESSVAKLFHLCSPNTTMWLVVAFCLWCHVC